jgi:magnesium-protoporphyrin O-methyltransferase
MTECCSPNGYRRMFSRRSAQADARRYRRKGLDGTSRRIFEFLTGHGIAGRSVLEVGGGCGALQLELLKAGASRAVGVELTPTYEEAAAQLINESGLSSRIQRRVGDFAVMGDEVPSADVVVMNRVVCCYPDMPGLATAAADHAGQLLVMSYPRQTWWTNVGLRIGNLLLRLGRREFQVFLHPPDEIIATTKQRGLKLVLDQPGMIWTVAALRREEGANLHATGDFRVPVGDRL